MLCWRSGRGGRTVFNASFQTYCNISLFCVFQTTAFGHIFLSFHTEGSRRHCNIVLYILQRMLYNGENIRIDEKGRGQWDTRLPGCSHYALCSTAFDCGLIYRRDKPTLACSSDVITLMAVTPDIYRDGWQPLKTVHVTVAHCMFVVVTLEIKRRVFAWTFSTAEQFHLEEP